MDLKLMQGFLPYALIALITITSLFWSRRSRWSRGNLEKSINSEEGLEASSPPSSSPPFVREKRFEYDVFLSFRGPDTRKTFTGHLHQALKDKGIITFIDNDNLEKGQKVEELFGYIQRSKIFVPIFSKGYADSEWCLKEITEIMECGRLIIPVFFHVEPRNVRHQTGPFESAFKRYHASQKKDLNKWSDALAKAGEVSGYDLAESKGDEAELIRRIVKRLLTEVNKARLFVAKHPVGLDSRIADVIEVLDIESHGDARIVGIYGMGGMGKTTLAKAVYNQISSHFEACSFLSNIREVAKQSSGLVSLQKQLLRNIFQDEHVDINSSDEGIGKIQERIGAKKVLLVLDDVDDQSQLDALAGCLDWFCLGSRIIITTRDKGALKEQRVNLYELKELDAAQSLQLFSWHAFGKEKPDAKFAELSKEVASIASGLPLALKVFGPLFLGFETDEKWGTMLARLKAAQHPSQRKDIYEKLKISYDVLCEEEKKVFLDIACFFVGEGREHAALMWEACDLFPESTIDVLMCKCLVSINDDNGELEMHDQIRDMGRRIVKDESPSNPGMRSRLWKDDEALDVLQNKTGAEKIEAIQLNLGTYVEAESFVAMSQLRMLRLGEFVHLKGEFQHFPKKLRWLQLCIKGDLDSLPGGLHLENIVVLDLSHSSITQLWNPQGLESTKVFGKLKVLKLSPCVELTYSPDFESMPNLEILDLRGCRNMSELHPSIGNLKNLTHLFLLGCRSLKRVPREIWQLTSLEELDLSYCSEITTLPSQMEDPKLLKEVLLGKLKILDFSYCSDLTICPDFTSMPHLQLLKFEGCRNMSELHPSIWLLESLTHLSLEGCSSLKTLPQDIGLLESLTHLYLEGCSSLKTLPQEIWQLTSLKELDLQSCSKITSLPSQMEDPKSLKQVLLGKIKVLNFSYCYNLTICPDFTSTPHLEKLNFSGCRNMSELHPSIGLLESLTHLSLHNCGSLKTLPQEIWQLTSLEELDLYGCNQITTLPSQLEDPEALKQVLLGKLKVLNFSYCSNLTSCSDFTSMPHLQKLNFDGCKKMSELHPSIGLLESLTRLSLDGCWSLKTLPQEIWQLTSLEELDLTGCTEITTWPSQMEDPKLLKQVLLGKLKVLNFRGCSNLTICPDFTSMPHLQNLNFAGCKKMSELHPSIGLLESLTYLHLWECMSLKTLPQEIWQLTSLEELDLRFCSKITTLPSSMEDLKSLKLGKLKVLNFQGCSNLIICPDFTSMPHLKKLNFSGCKKMSELHPSIGLIRSLVHLNLWGCGSLKELPPENWHLTSLEVLDLSYCAKITTLPSQLGNSKALLRLSLRNCKSLMELPKAAYQLTSLNALDLSGCDQLEIIPDVSSRRLVNVLGIQTNKLWHATYPIN